MIPAGRGRQPVRLIPVMGGSFLRIGRGGEAGGGPAGGVLGGALGDPFWGVIGGGTPSFWRVGARGFGEGKIIRKV